MAGVLTNTGHPRAVAVLSSVTLSVSGVYQPGLPNASAQAVWDPTCPLTWVRYQGQT